MVTSSGSSFVIETSELVKMYGPHLALDGVNLKLERGATGFLGPNGAGKSTFFKCILGLIKTTSGDGSVLGYDIRTQGEMIRSRIGYMPEYDSLDPDLIAIDQVRYSGELLGMNSKQATQRAHEVLEYVGLKDQRYRKIETFSTGMKQATKLACALIHDPEILICDEPTNGLDSRARTFMLDTLKKTVTDGGRSVLMSGHVMDDIQEVCENIVMIHQGRIVVHRQINELARQVDVEIEISVWGGSSKMQTALEERGMSVRRLGRVMRVKQDSPETINQILTTAADCNVQVRKLNEYKPDLEDIFLLIMERLGQEVKGAKDLMTEGHTGGGEDF
ncbi:MAG: ABC transporter [Euryarchaeota archaeon]|nr:ABC transporter [Euryarchaeota archaeon]